MGGGGPPEQSSPMTPYAKDFIAWTLFGLAVAIMLGALAGLLISGIS